MPPVDETALVFIEVMPPQVAGPAFNQGPCGAGGAPGKPLGNAPSIVAEGEGNGADALATVGLETWFAWLA
jgi:hypothetical protein